MNKLFHRLKGINNERGMALVAVLLVVVVVSILGVTLMGLAASNVKMSSGERNNQSTYYVAESGATYMMSEITKKVQEAYANTRTKNEFYIQTKTKFTENNFFTNHTVNSFENNFGQQPIAQTRIQEINSANGEYKIISTGTINNRTRTVEQYFKIRWSVEFPRTAVFVDNTITVDSGSAIINGSIGTNSIATNAITLHDSGSIQTGAEIIVGPNAPNQGKDVVNLNNFTNIHVLDEEISLDLRPFKEAPTGAYSTSFGTIAVPTTGDIQISSDSTVNISNTIKLRDFSIDNNKTLNINVGDKNLEMYVGDMDVSGTLNIAGTGTLSIYVAGNLTFHNGVINENANDRNKLTIYVKKSTTSTPKTISATSTPTGINCSIFAEDAIFDFTGGTFRGKFVTGGLVTIGGNNVIEGAIVANSLHLKGNSTITFIENDHIALPFPAFEINPLNPEPVRET
jgi:Tfp pilus assembly protein PilX